MPETTCGRYCEVCHREVIDFRGVSKKQLEELRGKDVCGIFLPEQVEDGITPIKLPKARFVAASFLTFLGMEVQAQPELTAKPIIPTEQIADDSVLVHGTVTDVEESPENNALSKKEIRRIRKVTVSNTHRAFIRTNHASYYWTKRFPFIVRRRAYRGGKF